MPVPTTVASMAADGCLVKPLFYQFILDPRVAIRLNLAVSRPVQRDPDGWFHASSHPMATDRELWLWMNGRAKADPRGYDALMSVMFGSLGHAVVEAFLDWMRVAVPLPEGDCPACGRPRRALRARPDPSKYCTEHGFCDPETMARCHLDSILDFLDGSPFGFDFKTIYPLGLKGVTDMDAAAFRAKWPRYWAQMQECMRLSGLRRYIVFFLALGHPWDTREFHLDYDEEFAATTRAKYLRVLHHVRNGTEILV